MKLCFWHCLDIAVAYSTDWDPTVFTFVLWVRCLFCVFGQLETFCHSRVFLNMYHLHLHSFPWCPWPFPHLLLSLLQYHLGGHLPCDFNSVHCCFNVFFALSFCVSLSSISVSVSSSFCAMVSSVKVALVSGLNRSPNLDIPHALKVSKRSSLFILSTLPSDLYV
jgi:hypothetical protein